MPRKRLTRKRVLQAAVRIVDAEGLSALSMRRLGHEVGVEAMSLYRHVANKADLLDGIHGAILEEMRIPAPRGPWQARLRALAMAFREVLVAHPNALPVFATRPAVAATSLRSVELTLQVLEGAGFKPAEQVYALQSLASYVVGLTMLQYGLVDEQYTEVAYSSLPAEEFPRLAALAVHLEETDLEQEFAFGLDALLAGLKAKARKR